MKSVLTISQMFDEAKNFAEIESVYAEPSLFGVTDGKAVGTYVEHKFKAYLAKIMKLRLVVRHRELIYLS